MATEKELRQKLVKTAKSYMGAKRGGKEHRFLMDTFNKVKPDGWAMNYMAPWCAASASAFAILAFGEGKAKKYFPLSANCGTIITKAKKMGIWQELRRIETELHRGAGQGETGNRSGLREMGRCIFPVLLSRTLNRRFTYQIPRQVLYCVMQWSSSRRGRSAISPENL